MLKLPHTHLDSVNALPMLRAGRVFCFLTRLLPRHNIDAFALMGGDLPLFWGSKATLSHYVPGTRISAVGAHEPVPMPSSRF